ncbi:hypothetical protein [Lentzea jiangxiensis]|nr:hypothetical protein [Lentzea jiangxiensis]
MSHPEKEKPVTAQQEFQLARVFDFVDPESGPGFVEDHPRVQALG